RRRSRRPPRPQRRLRRLSGLRERVGARGVVDGARFGRPRQQRAPRRARSPRSPPRIATLGGGPRYRWRTAHTRHTPPCAFRALRAPRRPARRRVARRAHGVRRHTSLAELASSARHATNFSRAWNTRLFTVPSGAPSASLASRYVSPRTSTISNASRSLG